MLLLCLLKMKSVDVGLLLLFAFSTTLQFFSVPLPRSKSAGHSDSPTTVATPRPTKDCNISSVVEGQQCFGEVTRSFR